MNDLEEALDPDAGADSTAPGAAVRLARRAVHEVLAPLARGQLRLNDALGSHTFGPGTGGPDVAVQLHDLSAYLDIATGGTIGAAEAYMAGKWAVTDLPGVMRLLAVNREVMDRLESGLARLGGLALKLAHWQHRNTRAGSRRNIHAHYDLGNELFELFLDPTMMYSSAVFPRPDATLEEASVHKLDLICRKLELTPGDHLLEIGTGWGGLALHAARHYGCRVTTTTISRNQFEFAGRRVRDAGLADRITLLMQDYRDLTGTFDKLVSVEMIEAVGLKFLDTYFRTCSERLKPAGRMLLQSITIADRHYEQARRSVDFIQKYIFPGGALPSLGAMLGSIGRATDLQLSGLHDIGLDYARTLAIWRQRFLCRTTEVRRLGYPDEFIRMWEWYLAYCEGGFLERAISAVQVVFDKPDCRLAPAGCAAPA
ncbi:MAG: class I SAM-dependent methyltransferase [Gammaproteobacteria bacterium]|jgi:cyclopropane-fatty-acyl-phospholipid synthase|nr:class I SAM-dependent methyltransferase [Gammaproteobacteria bacterium]